MAPYLHAKLCLPLGAAKACEMLCEPAVCALSYGFYLDCQYPSVHVEWLIMCCFNFISLPQPGGPHMYRSVHGRQRVSGVATACVDSMGTAVIYMFPLLCFHQQSQTPGEIWWSVSCEASPTMKWWCRISTLIKTVYALVCKSYKRFWNRKRILLCRKYFISVQSVCGNKLLQ